MTQRTHRSDADRERPAASGPAAARLVVPSADVLAVVRFDDPPTQVPEALLPFVVHDRATDDWLLTDDAVAFGAHDVVADFTAWRSTWERTWALDPVTSLRRLVSLGQRLLPADRDPLPLRLDDNDDLVLDPDAQARVLDDLQHVAGLIRERGAEGIGIVDTSPGTDRVGLARSWPAHGGDEVVAADRHTEIRFVPADGLVLTTTSADGVVDRTAVDEVVGDDAGFRVSGPDSTFTIDTARARPLGWLMPRSTAWRVRRIPEIVAWARTLGGFEEAVAFASDLDLGLRLTHHRPIAR